MIVHLQTRFKELKLTAMADALQTQLDRVSIYEPLTFVERLTLLLDHESHDREQRKQDRFIQQAHFKLRANVQDIDYTHKRNITQSQIALLAQSQWIARAQNLLVTGDRGTGKTWLCCVIGHSACLNGLSVRYYRLSRLLLELTQAKADGGYTRQLKVLPKVR